MRNIFFIILSSYLLGQELYDPYTVHHMNIDFYDANYDSILEARWYADDKSYLLADITFNGVIYDSVGVRYKGNSSFVEANESNNPKVPFNIDVEFVHDDQNVMGYEKLKLSNSIFDPTFVRETIGYLSSGFYLPTPQAGYVNVSIYGEDLGLYVNAESINKQFLRKHFGNDQGTFFKCEPQFQYGEDYLAWPDLVWHGADSNAFDYQYGYELKSEHGWSDLIELISTLNYDTENIEQILNVDRVLWYFASSVVIPDLDSYIFPFLPHNYYLYRSASGQFEVIPWDKDQSFGGSVINLFLWLGGNAYWVYQHDPFFYENDSGRPLFSKLMDVPLYKLIYTAHMRTIIDEIYNTEYYYNWATEIQDSIESYAVNDPNLFYPFTLGNYFRYNVTNYLDTDFIDICGIVSTVGPRRTYLLNNIEIAKTAPIISLVSQNNSNPLPGDSVYIRALVENATQVELMITNNEYSTFFESIEMHDDGMHHDGEENDNTYGALVPFFLNGENVKYYVRARDNDAIILNPRKAEREFFQYSIGSVPADGSVPTINEINYNSSDNFDPEDWVEIYNPTDSIFDMSNWFFRDQGEVGDDHLFIIPEGTLLYPNEYIVLCRDTIDFKNHFPMVDSYMGDLGFGLSGGGELIRLYNNDGILMDSLTYDDDNPWPPEPDGDGPTLELINPFRDNGLYSNWSPSIGNGTPGAQNSNYLGDIQHNTSPEEFRLYQNYPNPFNPQTTIMYYLPQKSEISLIIYDAIGREVRSLDSGVKSSGYHTLSWDSKDNYGKSVSTGIYIYQLQTEKYIKNNKMILIK